MQLHLSQNTTALFPFYIKQEVTTTTLKMKILAALMLLFLVRGFVRDLLHTNANQRETKTSLL